MFCPKCRTEYRPGFTICADCGLTLVAILPPKPPGEAKPQTNLVTVFESFSLAEIAIARSILDDAGIEYDVSGFGGGTFWGHAGRVIKVNDADAGRAHALLADIERGDSVQDLSGFDDIENAADEDPH